MRVVGSFMLRHKTKGIEAQWRGGRGLKFPKMLLNHFLDDPFYENMDCFQ